MTKIDIVSGFLGAGKTTLIQKLLKEALDGTKVVLIENEFGEIGIDGGFLKDAGIEIKEMNSGCICCSLVGDFGASLKDVLSKYAPERIIIEPSGVGKLSDVMKAVQNATTDAGVQLNSAVAVVDAKKCKMYIKNFGEFFINQIAHAGTIILSRTDSMSEDKLKECVNMIREHNAKATIITTPWPELDGTMILETIEGAKDLEKELMEEAMKLKEEEHHHHHHADGEECHCHDHHHDDDHEEHEHHHDHEEHEHHHDHEEHEHHHDHEEHEHHHEHEGHEHHHHADEIFTSWGMETPASYTKDEITAICTKLENEAEYGLILRAKGMVPSGNGSWVYFDYTPGETDVRDGSADITGKFCVIGSKLQEDNLAKLFQK
ncbi:MAG: GTP-binding protein [Lachnospiraceae bacterium]|nr:GTP-binding protein [Lachnospiraceae bacterium]